MTTINEIIHEALALRPALATQYKNGDQIALCTTRVYGSVVGPDGSIMQLSLVDGKYGAGYVRVSTAGQRSKRGAESRGDGWSEEDQITRIVHYFVSRGQAFRIFSDAGLGGGLAYNEPGLMKELRQAKHDRYQNAFNRIFLDESVAGRYTEEQRASMERYRDERLDDIMGGTAGEDVVESEKVGGITVTYRPGLTILMHCLTSIHTQAVTDMSRISRSHALFAKIAPQLQKHRIELAGLIESMDWATKGDLGGKIVTDVLTRMAEARLEELTTASIRGIVTMLAAGRPHALRSFWWDRNEDGEAVLDPEGVKTLRTMIDIFKETGSVVGTCKRLQDLRIPAPGRHQKGGSYHWVTDRVKSTLRARALVGEQDLFGLHWQTLPRVIDDAEFEEIQQLLDASALKKRVNRRKSAYLATGLIKCHCRASLAHRPRHKGRVQQYACSRDYQARQLDREQVHATLKAEDVDRFLDELMRYDPAVLMGRWRDSAARRRIKEDIERLQQQKAELLERQKAEEPQAREQAAEKARLLGMNDDMDTVAFLTKKILARFDEERQALEGEIARERERLSSILPTDEIETLEARARAWDSLSLSDKNVLLRTLFKEFRLEGAPPDSEVLVPVMRTLTDAELAPIPIKCHYQGRGIHKIAYRRELPSVEGWFASMLGLHSQRLSDTPGVSA